MPLTCAVVVAKPPVVATTIDLPVDDGRGSANIGIVMIRFPFWIFADIIFSFRYLFAEQIAPRCARVFTRAQIGKDHSPFFVGLDLRAFARRVAHALRAAAAQSTFFFAGFAMLVHPLSVELLPSARVCARAAREPSEADCSEKPIGSRLNAIEKFIEANFASAETTFRIARPS